MSERTAKEYRVGYGPNAWSKGGFTEWTEDRRTAENEYDLYESGGRIVSFYERDVSPVRLVER